MTVQATALAPAATTAAPSRRALLTLLGLGLAGLPLYIVAYRLGSLPYHPWSFALLFAALCALHAAACRLVVRRGAALPMRPALLIVGALALAYRLVFVPAVPSLSDDFFRYVWDGHIQRAGYSPYRSPPAAPELAPLRDGYYWPKVNRKEQTSAYPPLAELLFRALYLVRPFSTLAFKLAFLSLDLLTIGLLGALLRRRGASPLGAIVYAWHPLPVFEFLHSAHVDVLAVTLLVAALLLQARGSETLAGVALGLATLTKLYPGLLLPAFVRRGHWALPLACVATVAAGFAPALLTGDTNFRQLPTYLAEEDYTSGQRYFPLVLLRLLAPVPTGAYITAVALILAGAACWLYLRPDWRPTSLRSGFDVPRRALWLAALLMLLVTPNYPWYYIWLLPLLAVTPLPALLYLTYAIALNYPAWWAFSAAGPMAAAQYPPVYASLAREVRNEK